MHDCGCTWHPGGLEGYAGGMYEVHYCDNTRSPGSWSESTMMLLDACDSLATLAAAWVKLEKLGEVDAQYGAEWHHAVAHMHYLYYTDQKGEII